ncbi:hypothetical protein SAMN05216302_1002150 [Nitrosomonas aestuarii]|uniref:Uncharacterized protein n=1 Tax=Nitrosomonas aestuarii TaxID=52441 RepID=A0A1I3Y0K0_9PROT|nr:contractile injection system tape measure protein [Nitrosomonas aestuarii]SFK24766.1 hypothetical protein SAMN05216302_1002150 [Nitrosomonas aestuarii]
MIIGSDRRSAHVIDEVVFDYLIHAESVAHEHESAMHTWVVDALLPVVETILDEYDAAENVLRIEQITLDLGDIPSADYPAQIIRRLREQLAIELDEAIQALPLSSQQSPRQVIGEPVKSLTGDFAIQQISLLQSDLEQLKHFLLTGRLPWYVDAIDSSAHEKLLERVLQEENSSGALKALLAQIPTTSRALFIRRLVNQFSTDLRQKLLARLVPEQSDLIVDLVAVLQPLLSTLQISASQRMSAAVMLWEQIFHFVFDNVHTLNSQDLSTAVAKILNKVSVSLTGDANVLSNRLIHAAKSQRNNPQLLKIVSASIPVQAETLTVIAESHSLNKETDMAGKQAVTTKQTLPQPYEAILYQRIIVALAQAGINDLNEYPENLQSPKAQAVQQRLLKMLKDATIRIQLAAKLPKPVLLDIIYLLSPYAAAIVEQMLFHAETLCRSIANRRQITFDQWERKIYEKALCFFASISPDCFTNTLFEATGFMDAIVNAFSHSGENAATLQFWHEALLQQQPWERGGIVLMNIISESVLSYHSEHSYILSGNEIRKITEAMMDDFETQQRRLKAAFHAGRLIPERLPESELRNLIQTILEFGPESVDTDRQAILDTIEAYARKAVNSASYYQQILENLLCNQAVDLEAITLQNKQRVSSQKATLTPAQIDYADQIASDSKEKPDQKLHTPEVNAVIFQRLLSAIDQAAINWAGLDLSPEKLPTDNIQTTQKQLLELFQDAAIRTQLISQLPLTALIDFIYLQSPQAAMIVEQMLLHADAFYQHTVSNRFVDITAWKRQLFESALRCLVSASTGGAAGSLSATIFVRALLAGLSDDKNAASVLQSWREILAGNRLQAQGSVPGTGALQNMMLGIIAPASPNQPVPLSAEEIRQITTASPADSIMQRQRLKTLFYNGQIILGELSQTVQKALIQALLEPDLRSGKSDQQAFVEAIDMFASKVINTGSYYQRILENLLLEREIDLEAIIAQTLADGSGSLTQNEPDRARSAAQMAEADTVIMHRIQSAFIEVDRYPEDMHYSTELITQKRLLEMLQNVAIRKQLIAKLPESVWVDIVFMLSSQAAIILEQLLLHAETLCRITDKNRRTKLSEWKKQLLENALHYLVATSVTETAGLSVSPLNIGHFIQAAIPALSENEAAASILQLCQAEFKQQSASGRRAVPEYGMRALQNILLQTVLSTPVNQQVILTDMEIEQITAALADDFKMQWQYLTAVFYSGKLIPGRLSNITLKNLTLAILEHDPASTETDRLTWINAVKTHSRKTVDSAFYFQQILEKRILDQAIDLKIIADESTGRNCSIQKKSTAEGIIRQPAQAVAIINQRLQSALRQAAIIGTTDLYFEEVNAVDAETVRKHLLEILQDSTIRKQLIAKLPESALIDITYLLSPQAAIILEQLLLHAELFYQHAVNLHYAGVAEWKCALWHSSMKMLLTTAGTDSLTPRFDPVFFIRTLITEMSDSRDDFPIIQSWHNVLARIQKTVLPKDRYPESGEGIVLQHLLQTCMMRRNANACEESKKSLHPQFDVLIADELTEVDSSDTSDEAFSIHNAGQILAAPYLPRLFGRLGLIEAGVFIDRQAAERAVHLLQFMVNEKTHSPEYWLLLNKILCGLSAGIPVCNQIELSYRERDTIEDLMRGMIQNWKTIGKTSIKGLRETFLQRQGRLQLKDGIWFLTIEPGPFDMLLDQLPWSFSVIKHSWMERAIHVTWR